jgi:TPR repeat protein
LKLTEEIQDCYRLLGLTPGQPFEVVQRAYRKLLKAWHPDRFHDSPQQTQKANEKLKELIPAYERLKEFHSGLCANQSSSATKVPAEEIPKTPQQQYETALRFAEHFDYGEAAFWFRKAAEQGHRRAQHNLGKMFLDGLGVTQDYEEAIRWLLRAAKQEFDPSIDTLNSIYSYGWGAPQEEYEKLKWYRTGACEGVAEAQYRTGCRYAESQPPLRNFWEAVK